MNKKLTSLFAPLKAALAKAMPTFFPAERGGDALSPGERPAVRSGAAPATGAASARKKLPKPFLLSFSTEERMHFAKRLSMIMRSGMPIVSGISMLGSQAHSSSSAYIFQELIAHVASGQPLSSGLKKFEKIFGEFAVSIVKVGETIGTLPDNLQYLAEELKKNRELTKKVQGALIYPAVIVVATFAIAGFLTVYIFPKITPIFASLKSELPLSTKFLMWLSSFLIDNGFWVVVGFAALVVGMFFALKLKQVKLIFDRTILMLPLFGPMFRYYNVANITRTLGLLLKSDVKIAQAFDILAESSTNLAYRESLTAASEEIVKGRKISSQFDGNKSLFPPIIPQMIAVGEQTGNLSGSLLYCSEMYEEELNDLTKNLTTIIEPVLMVVMGLIVGFVAVSIITPIYGITQSLTPH